MNPFRKLTDFRTFPFIRFLLEKTIFLIKNKKQNTFLKIQNTFLKKQNTFLKKQNTFLEKQKYKTFLKKQNTFLKKQNTFLKKQNTILEKQNTILEKQNPNKGKGLDNRRFSDVVLLDSNTFLFFFLCLFLFFPNKTKIPHQI